MLRTIRKYQKSVLGIVAIGLVALAMSGFGVNLFSQHKEPYAIKVGDALIPLSQIAAQRRAMEDRYQQILGDSYGQLFKSLKQDLPQQVVDQTIDREVLQQEAAKAGLYAGDDQVRSYLMQQVFPNGFNNEQYSELLRRQGMDARQFEDGIRKDIERDQLLQLVSLGALPSEYEAKATLQREEQSYDISSVALKAETFLKDIPQPTDEAIKTYYENNSSNFEVPSQIAYAYADFKPEAFESRVEIQPEDVEVEYSENLKRYMTPLEINARHIQINVAKDADEATRKKAQDLANDIISKLKAGGDFAALARQYSSDTATSLLGGSLGWIKKGKMNPAFDKAAFELKAGELSAVVEVPYGFHIIKVDERRDPQQKKLEDVKAEIEAGIRKREAPALAASLAQSYAEEFRKTTLSLADFLKQKGLENLASTQPLSSEKEAPTGLPTLTKAAFNLNNDKDIVELKDTVLVQITDRKDAFVKPISEVTTQIAAYLKAQAATELVQKKASEISAKIQDGSLKTIADVATAAASTVATTPNVKVRDQASGFLSEKKVKDAVNSVTTTPKLLSNSFASEGILYFVQVDTRIPAEEKDITAKLIEQKDRVAQQLDQTLTKELSEKLKSETEIDVKPEALR